MSQEKSPPKTYSIIGVALLHLLIVLLLAIPNPAFADSQPSIVVFQGNVLESRPMARQLANRFGFDLGFTYAASLKGFSARLTPNQIDRLSRHPAVRSVTPERQFSIPQLPSTAQKLPSQVLPSGIDRVGADLNPNTGFGIDVAVFDSGIDLNHPDLVVNIGGGIGFIGNDTGQDDNYQPFLGVWGHGTHVAGVIAAADNNIGVVGMAPETWVWAVKVCNKFGLCGESAILAGFDWVAESHLDPAREPIEVINMSLGGSGADDGNCGYDNDDPQHQAICSLVNNFGVTVVVAAGNEAQDTANVTPAAYDEVITVSALDDADDTFASFSNYGADVDIIAPGVAILSTALQPRFLGQYSELSGTSFSAPHVAGAAALYIRTFMNQTGLQPTPVQVKAGLLEAAEAGSWPGDPDGISEPLLDAEGL